MGAIHKLSPVLSNQIAAGEVVERPASVVKELVENAIDAGSTQIDIAVQAAGFEGISVVDDGHGIAPADVALAFTRHATSKIADRRDLFNVHSLGFRGEALPSIASVADVLLKTSTGEQGVEYHVRGGEVVDRRPAELRRGTAVQVSQLFYNTPARLKYMKTPATELARITDVVDQLALGHPQIAFSLTHNHRELLRTAGRGNLLQVLGSIYGNAKVNKLVHFEGADADFKIAGYCSLPELTRANRNYVTLILNGRFVKNINLMKAVAAGYGSKLMVGRYPIAVLNITVDPTLIDVNVHPTKQTVRVSKEEELCNLIAKTIGERLAKQNLIPDVLNREQAVKPRYRGDQLAMELNQATVEKPVTPASFAPVEPAPSAAPLQPAPKHDGELPPAVVTIKDRTDLAQADVQRFVRYYQTVPDSVFMPATAAESVAPNTPEPTAQAEPRAVQPSAQRFPELLYIGQMHGTYLIAEAADGMYIVDQHAAQERINYERFRESIGEVATDEQALLVPIVLDYSTTDALLIKERAPLFEGIGIYLDEFGPNSFIVRKHPTWFANGQEEQTLREIIDWVLTHGKISVAAFRAQVAITMSCKRAIKANHHLDRKQAVQLLAQLAQTEDPFNCPHGRPVLVHFTNYDMEKMFKRVQDPHESRTNRN